MTVGALIDELSCLPPDLPVRIAPTDVETEVSTVRWRDAVQESAYTTGRHYPAVVVLEGA